MCYLANQYGKDDSLYPKDPKKRALVDLMLYFDMGTLHQNLTNAYAPAYKEQVPLEDRRTSKIPIGLEQFDKLLEGKQWAAGDNITIADCTLVATVASIEIMGFDISGYKNVSKWYGKCKEVMKDYYEECNEQGNKEWKEFITAVLQNLK